MPAVVVDEEVSGSEQLRGCRQRVRRELPAAADALALELVVTELLANAIDHGRPPVRLRVLLAEDAYIVAVHDRAEASPVAREQGRGPARGRGLQMVSHLATQWGVCHEAGGGKWVFARLPRRSADDRRDPPDFVGDVLSDVGVGTPESRDR